MLYICKEHNWDTIEDTEPCPYCAVDKLTAELSKVKDERDSYEKLYKKLLAEF